MQILNQILICTATFIMLILCAALAGSVQAQTPTPVAEIENSSGEAVFISFEDGGLLGLGEFDTGTIPIEGAGTRLMWYPGKAAFRAGRVSGDQWDDDNIGNNSVAMGLSTTASGGASTAMGLGTIASGDESTAMGLTTIASGDGSTAMNRNTTASGRGSTAMGLNSKAQGNQSTAMGSGTTASGGDATAMGSNTIAATPQSLSIGEWNSANTSPDNTLFVAGNGSFSTLSDALVLKDNGDLIIAGDLTSSSDRRLKTDITPLGAGMLDKLSDIRPVRYRFKEGTGHPEDEQIGLIAQEVQAHFPELVSTGSDGYLSLSYSKLTAVLLKGVQEQQQQIATLEQRLATLEQTNRQAAGPGWGTVLVLAGLLLGGLVWTVTGRRRKDLTGLAKTPGAVRPSPYPSTTNQ